MTSLVPASDKSNANASMPMAPIGGIPPYLTVGSNVCQHKCIGYYHLVDYIGTYPNVLYIICQMSFSTVRWVVGRVLSQFNLRHMMQHLPYQVACRIGPRLYQKDAEA